MILKEIIKTVEDANDNLKKLGRKELAVDIKFNTDMSRTITTVAELNELIVKQPSDVKSMLRSKEIIMNGYTKLLERIKDVNKVDNFIVWVKVRERF